MAYVTLMHFSSKQANIFKLKKKKYLKNLNKKRKKERKEKEEVCNTIFILLSLRDKCFTDLLVLQSAIYKD